MTSFDLEQREGVLPGAEGRIGPSFEGYACPACKRALEAGDGALLCPACQVRYPVVGGIPDFVLDDLSQSASPVLRGVRFVDRLAPIYESRLWYPLVLNVYGGWGSTSLAELVRDVADILAPVEGCVLDVACGPGTFGRRVASPSRAVCGIDISMGMLRQGAAYVARDGVTRVRFARAMVEALPFPDAHFDAAICCGSLHLFVDTVAALHEIGRTMKAGAPLAVMTFVAADKGILRFRRVREHVARGHGAHVFEIPELEGYLTRAGFEGFSPKTYGAVLVFSAGKRR